jgi:putative pyruvate formate lyase activating enzyme
MLGFGLLRLVKRADWEPAYLRLERSGELKERVEQFRSIYAECRLCPRGCGVNRLEGKKGVCKGSSRARVASHGPHFGEERPLVGRGGSGTIFFSRCNLLCEFCQNWEISHRGDGTDITDLELARMIIALQQRGCHNINVVTPTHFAPNIVSAVRIAAGLGLRLPIVWNCSGYDSLEAIKLLDGIVDIYLPDLKYMDGDAAAKLSRGARDYPETAAAVIAEMHRQTGNLTVDEKGIALRGVMIRHLVMPDNLAGTDRFVKWVAQTLGPETYVNIMGQYRPEYRAHEFPEIARRTANAEYTQALAWAKQAGLTNLD